MEGFKIRNFLAIMQLQQLLSGVDFMEYIDYKYKVNCIRRIYSVFYTLVDVITVGEDGETIVQNVVKKWGRPRKLRIRSRGESAITRRVTCRTCGGIGHNSYTCCWTWGCALADGTGGVVVVVFGGRDSIASSL